MHRTLALLTAAGSAALAQTTQPPESAVSVAVGNTVNVRAFTHCVSQPGTDTEDWQPAFQKAIDQAQTEFRPLYVPAGTYRIRKPITIVPREGLKNTTGFQNLRIVGDGRHQSVIWQQVETENVIDWTGLTYEDPCTLGELVSICLQGGATALNIKWHNYFSLDSCYIHGARDYGIYAEGWSCRFRNSIIRWCFKAGIRGTGHFNNNIVRDCYFSRDRIGFHFTGGYGNRVEGTAFESCAKAAVFLRGTNGFTINNCYFEGNGYTDQHASLFQVEGTADTVHLDYACAHISIHDNIFRCNRQEEGALISVAYTIKCLIADNTFINSARAIMLRDHCETNANAKPHFGQMTVARNLMKEVKTPLSEMRPGLIDQALRSGSAFRLRAKSVCHGSPIDVLKPESIGDEILDLDAKVWYKSIGTSPSDWVRINR